MNTHKPNRDGTLTRLVATLLVMMLLSGCSTAMMRPHSSDSEGERYSAVSQKDGYVSIFLNLVNHSGRSRKIIFNSISIKGVDNSWTLLSQTALVADSSKVSFGQMFVGRYRVKAGNYTALRMEITGGDQDPGNNQESQMVEMVIDYPFLIRQGDSPSLFVSWDLSRAVGHQETVLSLDAEFKNLLVDVAYVACPKIDTLYTICTDKNRVCSSLGVPGKPRYLAVNPVIPKSSLYVLTEQDQNIKLVGPGSNRIEARYRLSMLDKKLTFTVSSDGQYAFIADKRRGNIIRVNLQTGSMESKIRLGYGPSFILYLEELDVVAVSLSLSQSVVFLDPTSLTQTKAISTGNKPEGLLLTETNLLYIAETGGNSVLVYDLTRDRIRKRIPVGLSPRRIISANGRIYVSNSNSSSISVLRRGQLGVSGSVEMDGSPLEMVYASNNKWLYVGNKNKNGLAIINPVNNKTVGLIELGTEPGGIAVLE